MNNQPTVTGDVEARILLELQTIHPAPWECDCCGEIITTATMWKPVMVLCEGEQKRGISRAIIAILCGDCVKNGCQPR